MFFCSELSKEDPPLVKRNSRFPIGLYQREKKNLTVRQVQLRLDSIEENNEAIQALKAEAQRQKEELEQLTKKVNTIEGKIARRNRQVRFLSFILIQYCFETSKILALR